MATSQTNPFQGEDDATASEELSSSEEGEESSGGEEGSMSGSDDGTSGDDEEDEDDGSFDEEDESVADSEEFEDEDRAFDSGDNSSSEEDDDYSGSDSDSGSEGNDYSSSESSDEYDPEKNGEREAFDDESNGDDKGLDSSAPEQTSFMSRIKKYYVVILCVCAVVTLAIAIGLGVGLGMKGKDDKTETDPAPTLAPSVISTPRPTSGSEPNVGDINSNETENKESGPMVKVEVKVNSTADTTIYRSGLNQDEANGDEETMLVQNGPPGDPEIVSAYSLVELSFDASDTDIGKIENPNVAFCLEHEPNDEPADRVVTYSVCLVPSAGDVNIDTISSMSANYVMPTDCSGNKIVDFDVSPLDKTVCMDVTPLIFAEPTSSRRTLRGGESRERYNNGRSLSQSLDGQQNLLMMIDKLGEPSDEPGDRFYTSNANSQSPPSLVFEGEMLGSGECQSIYEIVCSSPEFKALCSLIDITGLNESLSAGNLTVFAPTDEAFGNASGTSDLEFIFDELLDDAFGNVTDETDLEFIANILLYHTIQDANIELKDLVCDANVTMANGDNTTTQCQGDGIYQVGSGNLPDDLPMISSSDIFACNGIIHVVDDVLLPGAKINDDPTTAADTEDGMESTPTDADTEGGMEPTPTNADTEDGVESTPTDADTEDGMESTPMVV